MKNIIKNIVLIAIIGVFFIGCATIKHQQSDIVFGTSMKISYIIEDGTEYQIDSIIMADTLPNIKRWMHMNYTDYETNKKILKRMYVRTYKNGNESTYIIIGNEEPYNITKRITQ